MDQDNGPQQIEDYRPKLHSIQVTLISKDEILLFAQMHICDSLMISYFLHTFIISYLAYFFVDLFMDIFMDTLMEIFSTDLSIAMNENGRRYKEKMPKVLVVEEILFYFISILSL